MPLTAFATSHSPVRSPAGRRPLRALVAVAVLTGLTAAGDATAQAAPDSASRHRWEFMMSSGALVPTGAQRDVLKDAQLSTAQLSYVIGARLAVTAMTGWARSRDIASPGNPKLDVFTYDVGAEVRAPRWASTTKVAFTPLVGVGVGARSYNHRALNVDATHNVAAYASVGGELGMGRVGLRLEARDYVSGFKPLTGTGSAATRNDLSLLIGLRFNRHRAATR